jgi:hypothetical protein
MKTIFLSSDTKIITYCGQILSLSDKLNLGIINCINKDSKPVKIHRITKCIKDAVQIIPSKGISFICGKNTNIYIKRYSKSTKVNNNIQTLSLNEITSLESKLNFFHKRVKIIRCTFIDFKDTTPKIHPYIHGLFNSKESCIIQTADLDIINKINTLGKEKDEQSFWIDTTTKYIHSKFNWLTKELKRTDNIFQNYYEKSIPHEYVQTTNNNIKDYLAGLIDGGLGNIKSENHTIDITSRSQSFINSLSIMFRSCGFLVNIKETDKERYSTKRQKIENKLRLYASGEITDLPSIKCNKINPGRKSNRDWTICYFSLGFHQNIEGYEIEIDDNENILTEDFFIIC